MLRGSQDDLELTGVAGGLVDGGLEVELELVALAREGPELAERDLDLAHVEHEVRAVRAVGARVGHGHRALSAALGPDAHPRGVGAVGAEGARAARANPPVAAVVPLLLLLEALLEELPQRLGVEVLEHLELLGREALAHLRIAQPLFELLRELRRLRLHALEAREVRLVEGVEVRLGVDADRAGHVIEAVERAVVQAHLERLREGHRLLEADLHLALAELVEKRDEHRGRRGD